MKYPNPSPISRRKAVGLLGFGILAAQFPFACTSGKEKLSDVEKQSLHYLTLAEVAELIKSGRISSEEVTEIILNRIAALDAKLNSYITVMSESALNTARMLDKELAAGKYRGSLHGVPIGIKDLLFTTNAPTSMGHSFLKNFMAPYNATLVDKLQNAGAVIVGKLNQTEGAMGGYSDAFKVPRNPWGEDLWTGVSSSGSGSATAAGLCFGSIGSDTGGSIRFPSVANGIVGLKPTYGLVSKYGAMTLSDSLDHLGPMTRSTLDAAIMLDAMAGYDENDPHSLQTETKMSAVASIKEGMKGMRIGIDHDYAKDGVDPKLSAAIENAVEKMKELGAVIVPFKMPGNQQEMQDAWFQIASKEALDANKETFPSQKSEYGNYFAGFLEIGSSVTPEQYQHALQLKENFKNEFRNSLSQVDAFVAPAGGMCKGVNDNLWRAKFGEDVIAKFNEDLDLQFGGPADLAGIPALTMPCGKAEDGFPPYGFQLMGGALTEATLLRIGYAYEQATEWHTQHPSL